ncbi:hypothetical protein EON81_06460 [bacterium]|nr:MAG: hypothetical protein EON81_06460 [bacterium]
MARVPEAAVHQGRLQLPQAAKAVAPRAVFGDGVFDAEVTVGERGDAGLLFRVSEPSIGTDHYRGYYVGLSAERRAVVLGKADNAWFPLANRPCAVQAGTVHRVRVEVRGTHIRVQVDDMKTPVLEAEDASFSTGALGVRSYSNKSAFAALSARAAG